MKVKVNVFKCLGIALLLIVIGSFIIGILNRNVPITEQYKIKKFISDNHSAFSLKEIKGASDNGYELFVEFDGSELSLKESVMCYKKLLDYFSDEKMSLANAPVTFSIREINDSGPETIILSNRSGLSDDFKYSDLSSVHVSEISNNLLILNEYAEEIQELKIIGITDPVLPDLDQFEALKSLVISNCYNSKGEDILSEELVERLHEKGVEYN
ncbi:hypothetical protein [Ruminococcus albus]|uniref:Uncharacterized protein n=1 Tax=Ruminococcus albus TaxID=1264 RepID=A0A1I1KSD5_RUMAL|nr:hypothetical protein [Ruminococcus albus]SFC61608.1 hypothetical protein SAMN02910406_02056 [Ruminococcus albus]